MCLGAGTRPSATTTCTHWTWVGHSLTHCLTHSLTHSQTETQCVCVCLAHGTKLCILDVEDFCLRFSKDDSFRRPSSCGGVLFPRGRL